MIKIINGGKMEFDLMKKKLRKLLNEKRWKHSVNTSEMAYKLAKIYGVNLNDAKIAGLLHDCAKNMDYNELLQIVHENEVKFDFEIEKIPKVLHAFVGAIVARQEFDVQDSEILQAIRLHSTGGRNMTILDKIIYLSDKIEPLRHFKGIEQVRQMATNNLDRALLMLLDKGVVSLIHRGLSIYPATIEARNDILNKVVLLDA